MTSTSAYAAASAYAGLDAGKLARQMIGAADTSADGKISLEEFEALGESSAKAGGKKIEGLFQSIDADGDGLMTEGEITTFWQKISDTLQAAVLSAQEQGVPALTPPGGAEAPSGGGLPPAGGSDGGSGDDSEAYDPLDTNKDGVVSAAEKAAGTAGAAKNGKADLTALFETLLARDAYGTDSVAKMTSTASALGAFFA